MSAKIIGGMTPPIGAFVASLIARDKFTQTERDTAITAFPMGLCFITEGVLPFAAADPVRFIPLPARLRRRRRIAVGMGVESMAGHGGIFVFPAMVNPMWQSSPSSRAPGDRCGLRLHQEEARRG